ncbi:lipid II:glycine glycyltransferase FemX [Anaeromyxobacter paludicola]|uniref:Methicillin resistance protein n=1 Tax=Anaeromyxobacter paludicola TaxID=2918171 RepID=A0ABN6N9D9_9BACT|nr:peptidoglycan bridge formation glycyltransferase FemA/FemB family protein [Anaeromyxobacter paludicola]BDG08518.1 methicillin resistance protein [Anaeromyxobacter paludicola]
MTWELKRLEPATFDAVTAELGGAHVFQSAGWARVRERSGWRPHFLGVAGDDGFHAALLCLEKRRYGLSVVQLPRGPVLRPGAGRPQALESALQGIRALARERLAAYVKITPDLGAAESWAGLVLSSAGARPSPSPSVHVATLRIDLTAPEAQLLARMESRTRYAIRKAQEAGVEVLRGREAGLLEEFEALYRETCRRVGIPGVPARTVADMVSEGLARIYLARHQGVATSGALILCHGRWAWYLLGGSRRGVKHTGAELLHWTAMRDLRAEGAQVYDLQGIPPAPDKEDPAYGVYLFKRGFGGTRFDLLGEFDLGSPRFVAGLGARAMSTLSAVRASSWRPWTPRS